MQSVCVKSRGHGSHTSVFGLSAVFLSLSIVALGGCDRLGAPPSQLESPSDAALALEEVITTDLLFALADRPRMERRAEDGRGGVRTYTFGLRAEPNMDPHRHFYLLTVTAVPVGSPSHAATAGAVGPGAAFVEQRTRTHDGAYELVLRLGSLLPQTVPAPALTLDDAARTIRERYARRRP